MRTSCVNERIASLAIPVILLLSLSLGGCASASKSLMDARAEDPAPAAPGTYLPVEVTPPDREAPALTVDERSKLKKELSALRDRQAAAVKARGKEQN